MLEQKNAIKYGGLSNRDIGILAVATREKRKLPFFSRHLHGEIARQSMIDTWNDGGRQIRRDFCNRHIGEQLAVLDEPVFRAAKGTFGEEELVQLAEHKLALLLPQVHAQIGVKKKSIVRIAAESIYLLGVLVAAGFFGYWVGRLPLLLQVSGGLGVYAAVRGIKKAAADLARAKEKSVELCNQVREALDVIKLEVELESRALQRRLDVLAQDANRGRV
jgi:hypothetical protein